MGFNTDLLIFGKTYGNEDFFDVNRLNRNACFDAHLWRFHGLVIELGRLQAYENAETQAILTSKHTPSDGYWVANQVLLTGLLPFWLRTINHGDENYFAPRFLKQYFAFHNEEVGFKQPRPERGKDYVALPLEYQALSALADRAKHHNYLLETNRVTEIAKTVTHPWMEAPCLWLPPPVVAQAFRSIEQEFPAEWSVLQKCPQARMLVNAYGALFDQLNGEDFRILPLGH